MQEIFLPFFMMLKRQRFADDFAMTIRPNLLIIQGMAKPPLILVSPSIERRGVEFLDLSISLSVKYDFAVLQSGGIPVTAPATTDRALLAESVRRTDGVLLTGGDDINPDLYTDRLPRAVHKTVGMTPDGGGRDLRELRLIDEALPPAQAAAGDLPRASIVKRGVRRRFGRGHPPPGARRD